GVIAALADIGAAPGQLQRRVAAHAGRLLARLVDGEQRRDLDHAADGRDADDGEHEADGAALDLAVEELAHLYSPGCTATTGASPALSCAMLRCAMRMVMNTLKAPTLAPARKNNPPTVRAM